MRKLIKKSDRDFVILNLTDIHMDDDKLRADGSFLRILNLTLDTLTERVRPDLITITGDLAWGGHHAAQRYMIEKLDSYGIPWAPVFGNHDHDAGDEVLAVFEEMLCASPYCMYEPGDRAFGLGNYTILIENEDGTPAEGLILLDSHQGVPYVEESGEHVHVWAKLRENQIAWYTGEVEALKKCGCPETAMFLHIPPYGYRQAWAAAFRSDLVAEDMPAPNGKADGWNPGYEGSYGVQYETVSSYPEEDGVLEAVVGTESTRYIFCGHDHVNNWIVRYRGVNFMYTLKTGCGAYWTPDLNGGTVIRVGADGISSVEHEYVEIPAELR